MPLFIFFTINWTLFIDIVLAFILFGFLIFVCFFRKLSYRVILAVLALAALFVISNIFGLNITADMTITVCAFLSVYAALLLTSPEKEKELRRNKKISKKESSLTVNETDELINNLTRAVTSLSATQTGAIITIEKTDDLSLIMQKSGTPINAPLSPELLLTIFYKGTPLHDGATIIRGNMIIYSAVFYQPTQKPLSGKYGSRHRAAIGISEICDSLTIVVSEESGKVSLTYKGELIPVPVSEFATKFKEYYYKK